MAAWSIWKLYTANIGILITFLYLCSLLNKWWLPKLRFVSKELLYGAVAIVTGWLSMAYALPLGESTIVDLRFLPLIVAPMFLKRSWILIPIGIGIGLGRFWFGWSEAAVVGFANMVLLGGLAALLHRVTRSSARWTALRRTALLLIVINVVNVVISAWFGVLGPAAYFRAGGQWVLPVSLLLSAGFALLLRDLQIDYARRAALLEEASRDFLTKLLNVRAFERIFPSLMDRIEQEGRPVSVAFLDIDYFKQVNDTYGHSAGDTVLRRVAEVLTKMTRWKDVVVRYGGEEFLIVLPDCTPDEARRALERIRKSIQDLTIRIEGETIRITISVGIASYPEVGRERLTLEADEALYEAKRSGRNQVRVRGVHLD